MNRRWLLFSMGAAACASTDAILDHHGEPSEGGIVVTDAGAADAPDAEVDAGPCEDCEYFPEVCSSDALCSNGPFDPTTIGGSLDMRAQVNAIRGRSPNDVWIAGPLGALAHFDGTSWARSDLGRQETLRGLWLRDSVEIALGLPVSYEDRLRVYARGSAAPDGGVSPSADGWKAFSAPIPPISLFTIESTCAWGAPGAESLWIAIQMSEALTESHGGLLRMRVSASSAFELEAVPQVVCGPECNRMKGVHGASANDVWAVGVSGMTMRVADAESETPRATIYDSRTWNTLNAVWAASDTEAWSVGAAGTIRHYAGRPLEWDVVPDVPTTVALNAVWGSSSSDVWAVGDEGVVLHYDGKSWSRVKIAGLGARRPKLTAVWVPAPGHVWIGGQGVFLSLGGKS